MSHQSQRQVGADHPSLPGHFPGRPIVPAVVILDEVIKAFNRWQPGWRVGAILSAKFVSPLLPGETMTIDLSASGEKINFTCHQGDRRFAFGQMLAEPPREPQ